MSKAPVPQIEKQSRTLVVRLLDGVEWVGNKLPDPVVLFLIGILTIWVLSFFLSQLDFAGLNDPRALPAIETIKVKNMLSLDSFASLLKNMVKEYTTFAPLGVVLVALLGVGVAEHAGFINAVLKSLLDITPRIMLTPMVILVAIISHTAADAGYVLVIPLAALMFHAAGRHPLAGIAAAFAGVSGGFSANFVPSGIDPLLSGLTEVGASLVNTNYAVNPLCNWYFTGISSFLIIGLGWIITDGFIEPKLSSSPVDSDSEIPKIEALTSRERFAMFCGLAVMAIGVVLLILWAFPANSSLRDKLGSLTSNKNSQTEIGCKVEFDSNGNLIVRELTSKGSAEKARLQVGDEIQKINGTPIKDFLKGKELNRSLKGDAPYLIEFQRQAETRHVVFTPATIEGAPLMGSIVPLIFILFVIPGIVHGYVAGRFKTHRDVVKGMSKSMESMAYYMVLVFFVALFIYVFNASNIGLLLAVKGASYLEGQPVFVIIIGIVLITAFVNLFIGSASAKWAMLAPIFVPMLMLVGVSPEFAQAAYRVGDSSTNIVTPLLPYFPLVVIYGQRYVKGTGIGTITSLMLPYSIAFLTCWTLFLLLFWQVGFPLGIDAGYVYQKAD